MRRKVLAASVVLVLAAVSVLALGASGATPSPDQIYVQTATVRQGDHWLARAVIATPPPPPPESGVYTRILQARGATRQEAQDRLIVKMGRTLGIRNALEALGLRIGGRDLS